MTFSIAAIVPMRHVSERVAGKNYRELNGLPLYHYIIRSLSGCEQISSILIDTDSEFILEDAACNFPEVVLYTRPNHLRDGLISMNDVLLNSIEQIPADFYLQTHSTNPFLSTETISGAVQEFIKQLPAYDSLFSVTQLQSRLWSADGKPVNHDPSLLMRTQDLEPLFEENSCIYMFSKDSIKQHGNRIGRQPLMFKIDQMEAMDIDTESDFSLAKAVAKLDRQKMEAT